jgi:23S rRNA pseudouridine2604 synthase
MRINKYLAQKKYCTRREADELIAKGKVLLNGLPAKLGDKVLEKDVVEVRFRPKKYRYFAYNKPPGIITHSPQDGEEDIAGSIDIKDVFPVGRLDKDSYGLIILTDDGRVTDALLNPEHAHEKEYEVTVATDIPKEFKRRMERGLDIGDHHTQACEVVMLGKRKFSITLTEGKKRQIRRMCGALGQGVVDLKRTRIANILLGGLKPGEYRRIEGDELRDFLTDIGLETY